MTDEEYEEWVDNKFTNIRKRLKKEADENPEHFWLEIESIIINIVTGCGEIGDFDWPDDLHLGDVLDKHLIRHIIELQDQIDREAKNSR